MQDLAKLCDLTEGEIDGLLAEGITPTPADVVAINAAAWGVRSPHNRMELCKGSPVHVGGVWLWPLTMEAGDWYRRVGCRLDGLEQESLAYAMAHCYAEGEPFVLSGPRKAIKAFVRTIKATPSALTQAISDVLQQMEGVEMPPRDENEHSKTMTEGELSQTLAAMTSIPPDFWERRCSFGYAISMLHTAMQQRNESGKPLPTDPLIQAEIALGWAVEKVRMRHREESEMTDGE